MTDKPTCRTCGDAGEVRAERWGERDCADPTEPCPDCPEGWGHGDEAR